ncbi:recombination protein RecA [Pseudomonas nitritireducens]|uniref:Protein RecA n=1 Tax=Pseudomonas nitroreducens TaxID=46680 RepID=A0A7W7KF21_PSENT|nr:recombination protein RecA [Pseudomonas nitritireducens]
MQDDKKRALAAALGQIERQFGKGAVIRMGDHERQAIPSISTGSLGLDIALGIGGLPRGRIVEIYGPESSGKTTLTLSCIAQAQKSGLTCAFVDAEHALDPAYAQKLGVNVDDLLVSQPDTGEQALEITDMLVRSNAVDVIIVDSVAALVPKAEIEGEMGDQHVGLQARLMSQALRKITGNIKNANCLVIFINQIRMKIGVMFGNPETTTGGNALKFYSSVRLDIRRTGGVKEGDEVVGSETRVKVVKNKVAPPFKQAEFQIMYGQGIYRTGEIIDLGVQLGLVEKSGAWYSYQGSKIGQGKANAAKYLEENDAVCSKLDSLIRDKLLSKNIVEPQAPVAAMAAATGKPELVVDNSNGAPVMAANSGDEDSFDSFEADVNLVGEAGPLVLDSSPLGGSASPEPQLQNSELPPELQEKPLPSDAPSWYKDGFASGKLTQKGPWVYLNGITVTRGHDGAIKKLSESPELRAQITG